MINILGSINIVTNIQVILNNPGYELLAMTEFDEELEMYVNILRPIPASILLPPYYALNYFVEQDIETFANEYMRYLSTPDVSRFLATIFKAMIMGKHLFIYVPQMEYDQTPFVSVLYDYIYLNYGIRMGIPEAPYSYEYNINLINLLYINNMFTLSEYLAFYPKNVSLPVEMVPKLLSDYNVMYPDPSINYLELFNKMKDNPGYSNPIQYK